MRVFIVEKLLKDLITINNLYRCVRVPNISKEKSLLLL